MREENEGIVNERVLERAWVCRSRAGGKVKKRGKGNVGSTFCLGRDKLKSKEYYSPLPSNRRSILTCVTCDSASPLSGRLRCFILNSFSDWPDGRQYAGTHRPYGCWSNLPCRWAIYISIYYWATKSSRNQKAPRRLYPESHVDELSPSSISGTTPSRTLVAPCSSISLRLTSPGSITFPRSV
jgi:hypothetical protein